MKQSVDVVSELSSGSEISNDPVAARVSPSLNLVESMASKTFEALLRMLDATRSFTLCRMSGKLLCHGYERFNDPIQQVTDHSLLVVMKI